MNKKEVTQEDIEAAIWLQNDSAYLHKTMVEHRNKPQGACSIWLTVRIQENAAHSARLARKYMGLE